MGRGKLALALIPKEKSRRVTFEKRKMGLMKKAHEFSILCGVDTCMIIYPDRASEPEVWPPEPEKVRRIIDQYRSEGPDRRSKRMTGLLDFFIKRKKKLDMELKKVRTANWEAKYPVSDEIIVGLSEDQLRSLLITLKGKLNVERLVAMKAAKLQEIAESEITFYDFCPKENDQMYPDHLTSVPSNFIDIKPGPTSRTVAMTVRCCSRYPIAHNDIAAKAAAFNGFRDHPYSPLQESFQFSPLGSGSNVSFPEPTFNFLSNMAFAENVGQCEGIPMPIQMQMPTHMPPISHQQMAQRIWFSGAMVEQQTTVVQAPPAVPYPGLNELSINSDGGNGVA